MRQENKETVDRCLTLSCSELLQEGCFDLATGERKSFTAIVTTLLDEPLSATKFWIQRAADDEMLLVMRLTEQRIMLRPTPLRFGGVRWWFICPKCERRCAKLHLPAMGSLFLCRLCHDLSYDSCNSKKVKGYTTNQLAKGLKEIFWWRYRRWRRKRDRRPDYRDRGARLRELEKV